MVLIAAVAPAQDKTPSYQIGVGFSNSEYKDLFSTRNEQGLVARLNAKIAAREDAKLILWGSFQFDRNCLGCANKLDTYSFGPEVEGRIIGKRLALFGHALFGLQQTVGQDKVFARTYGGGIKVYLGKLYVIPGEVNYRRSARDPDSVPQYSASVGLTF
jgi:hypothetical protein